LTYSYSAYNGDDDDVDDEDDDIVDENDSDGIDTEENAY
jgi:hypothetical protein